MKEDVEQEIEESAITDENEGDIETYSKTWWY